MDELSRFKRGEAVEAQRLGPLRRFVRKTRRHRAIAVLILVALLGLSGGGAVIWSLRCLAQEKYLNEMLDKSAQVLKKVPTAQNLEQKYQIEKNLESIPQEAMREIETALQQYLKAHSVLDQALAADPKNPKIKRELYRVEKEIGMLALLARNYMLSQVFFERCKNIGNRDEAQRLIALVKERENEVKNTQLKRVRGIMAELKKGLPAEGIIAEYVIEIVKMGGEHTVTELLSHLESENLWQRLVAIRVLGQIGDRRTRFEGKDVVEKLIARLIQVDLDTDFAEAVDLVWALGRLRDGRANEWVHELREKSGRNSVFWDKTSLPYSWIPSGEAAVLNTAEAVNKRGEILLAKGDFDAAIAEFTRAIGMDPAYSPAYNNRGRALCLKENLDRGNTHNSFTEFQNPFANASEQMKNNARQACLDFDRAIQLDSKYADAYINRGTLRHIIGDLDGALLDYERAVELTPKDPKIYHNRAAVYHKKGDLDSAIDDYTQAIGIRPDCMAYNNRGIAYYAKNDLDKALEDFTQAIELNPNAMAFTNRASVYMSLERREEALADFSSAIALNPKDAMAYHNRGCLYMDMKNLDAAIGDFNEAIKLEPDDAKAYSNRGNALAKAGMIEQAIADCEHAVRLAPDLAFAYYTRGRVFSIAGEKKAQAEYFEKAIADFGMAIKIQPDYTEAYLKRAEIYMLFQSVAQEMGEYLVYEKYRQAAIADHEEIVRLNPSDPQVYVQRGNMYLQLGETTNAIADYTTALTLNPKDASTCYMRGTVYHLQGDSEKALEDLDRALKIAPNTEGPYVMRGTVYRDQGKFAEAAKEYGTALKISPKSGEAYLNRGITRHLQGRFKDALSDFDKAAQYKSDFAPLYAHRALAHYKTGNPDAAALDSNKALEIMPELTEFFKGKAIAFEKAGQSDQAIYNYEIYLLLSPQALEAAKIREYIRTHRK